MIRLASPSALLVSAILFLRPSYLWATQTDIAGPAGSGQFGTTVTALPNGNFVVTDPSYNGGVGRVYLYNGQTLALVNTLTGNTPGDFVGSDNSGDGVTVLSNGNYVVTSSSWNNGLGAVTRCNATTGCPATISAANSLVGSTADDNIGGDGVIALPSGNYVVRSSTWDNGTVEDAGAITWCDGASGCKGVISAANSRVGPSAFDQIGSGDVVILANGNYVSINVLWDNGADVPDAGAVTFCSGMAPCTNAVSIANSLVGTMPNEFNGNSGVFALTNGNYIVCNGGWNNNVGAATFCNGTTGCAAGVGPSNSLTGAQPSDQVGSHGVTALTNGNYVVASPSWVNGNAFSAGAATFCSGTSGCTGVTVTTINSLYGSSTADNVANKVTALNSGNYVVTSSNWDNTALSKNDTGAATFCSGTSGCAGAVSGANSLVGSSVGDRVGTDVVGLANGNYVVASPSWNNPSPVAAGAGAVTFCSGTTGRTGAVTSGNSLAGSSAGDNIGKVAALTNGNYVVTAGGWNNGGTSDAGAATLCSGTSGCTGSISPANSLIGGAANNQVGGFAPAIALTNGSYVVLSPGWDNGAATDAGALTLCNGTAGCTGTVSTANSLVGSSANDAVGSTTSGQVVALPNGDYVAITTTWDNSGVTDAGAVTIGYRNGATVGPIIASNSVRGGVANGGISIDYTYDAKNNQLIVGRPAENKVSIFGQGTPGNPPSLRITSISRLANGHFFVQGVGVANATHTIERSTTTPAGTTFSSVGTATASAAGLVQFEDTSSGSIPRASYRLAYP